MNHKCTIFLYVDFLFLFQKNRFITFCFSVDLLLKHISNSALLYFCQLASVFIHTARGSIVCPCVVKFNMDPVQQKLPLYQ